MMGFAQLRFNNASFSPVRNAVFCCHGGPKKHQVKLLSCPGS